MEKYPAGTLNWWYQELNCIYADRNFYRTGESLFLHLIEVCAGIGHLVTGKKKLVDDPYVQIVKALTWWSTLCGRIGFSAAEQLIWVKFPKACPYCVQPQCLGAECKPVQVSNPDAPPRSPEWKELRARRVKTWRTRPRTLGGWQRMFHEIYPMNLKQEEAWIYGRLTEELGELGEAVRLTPMSLAFFVNEAVDVFAWLMALANKLQPEPVERGEALEQTFERVFKEGCPDCSLGLCKCEPIPPNKVGRLAQEVPEEEFAHLEKYVLSPDDFVEVFGRNMKVAESRRRGEDPQQSFPST